MSSVKTSTAPEIPMPEYYHSFLLFCSVKYNMINLYRWIKLYAHVLSSERAYNLLVRYSLAFSSLWLLITFAPYLPQVGRIAEITRETSTVIFFGITVRDILLSFIPLILGILTAAASKFEEKENYFPIKISDYKKGTKMLFSEITTKKELIIFLFISLGRGLIAMFNWVINYSILIFSSIIDLILSSLITTPEDIFLIKGRPWDEEKTTEYIVDTISKNFGKPNFVAYAGIPDRTKSRIGRFLLYLIKKIFGDYIFVSSDKFAVIISPTGITSTGKIEPVRRLYYYLIPGIYYYLNQCMHPVALGIEEKINKGEKISVPDIEYLFTREEIPTESIEIIKLKSSIDTDNITLLGLKEKTPEKSGAENTDTDISFNKSRRVSLKQEEINYCGDFPG